MTTVPPPRPTVHRALLSPAVLRNINLLTAVVFVGVGVLRGLHHNYYMAIFWVAIGLGAGLSALARRPKTTAMTWVAAGLLLVALLAQGLEIRADWLARHAAPAQPAATQQQ